MTKTFMIGGTGVRGGFFQSIIRALFLLAATVGGLFLFAASAAFAFFIVVAILILGLVTFAILWIRAKILGRPLMPNAQMWSYQTFSAEQQAGGGADAPDFSKTGADKADGPILDAQRTPDGWSIETD